MKIEELVASPEWLKAVEETKQELGIDKSRTAMNLFPELPEELSPRLKWMDAKNIRTMQTKDKKWVAYKSETQHHYTHEDEVDAVVGLAKKLKIRIWNE